MISYPKLTQIFSKIFFNLIFFILHPYLIYMMLVVEFG
jgi:hypothetical protein